MQKFNDKMNRQISFRGKLVRIIMPTAGARFCKVANAFLNTFYKGRKRGRGFDYSQKYISASSQKNLRLCIYQRENSSLKNRPLMLWIHGGGYGIGVPEQDVAFIKEFLTAEDCIVISPDYTRSIDAPYPAALNDCYDALKWCVQNADELGIDKNKIFIGGESAGGGLCLALAIYARDKADVNVAFQMPLYPMIEDRETKSNQNNDAPVWNTKSNERAWKLYLGDLYRAQNLSPYAVPARETNYKNLPPICTFVGDIEPFYDETVTLIKNLKEAGVDTHFKVFEGCYHGFDIVNPKSEVAKRSHKFMRETFSFAVKNYSKSNQ